MGPPFDEVHLRRGGVDAAKVARQPAARQLRQRPRELDPRRPPADDHELEQPAAKDAVGVERLGFLEGEEDAPSDLERGVQALRAGRDLIPPVFAEVVGPRASGDDEVVVVHRAVLRGDLPPMEVDPGHFAQQDSRVALPGENRADRGRDVGPGQLGHRHLVNEWLEEMVVLAIDHHHFRRGALERLGCRQPSEACADDHDARLP